MSIRKLLPSLGAALCAFAVTPSAMAGLGIGESLYIDFGKNDVSNGIIMPADGPMNTDAGNSTGVPDAYGIYWNNAWTNTATAGGPVPPDPVINLINSQNVPTGIDLVFTEGWESNGFNNGGLLNPDPALLGEFASKNAVGDYFFINKPFTAGQQGIASMTFYGLDTSLTYDFKIFATRAENQVRITEYTIIDINGTHTLLYQTSGAGIGAGGYNGNNDEFATFSGIVPNEFGEITLTVRVAQSDFAYIGALQLTAVPEPSQLALLAFGAGCLVVFTIRRRRAQN